MKNEKKKAEQYLGNRGISEPVKRAAYFEGLWFIVFENDPSEVEVSFACGIYEPYDFLPSKGFSWSRKNLKKIKQSIKN
jgi:hypothetical protein